MPSTVELRKTRENLLLTIHTQIIIFFHLSLFALLTYSQLNNLPRNVGQGIRRHLRPPLSSSLLPLQKKKGAADWEKLTHMRLFGYEDVLCIVLRAHVTASITAARRTGGSDGKPLAGKLFASGLRFLGISCSRVRWGCLWDGAWRVLDLLAWRVSEVIRIVGQGSRVLRVHASYMQC